MAKKNKKQLVLEELRKSVRESFRNFDFLVTPENFSLKFKAIKKQSRHLKFYSDEEIIFSEILENLDKNFLNEMPYFS